MGKTIRNIASLAFYLLSTALLGQDQLTNSGNLTLHGSNLAFFGDFVNNGTFADNGNVYFNGGSNQKISGSAATTFRNYAVNNDAGVTLQRNITVNNSIALTSGGLTLNGYTLTLSNASASALARTGGYIVSERTDLSSRLRWNIGTSTSTYVFPFGTAAGQYTPVTVQPTAGDVGNITIATYTTDVTNLPYPSSVTNMNGDQGDNSENVVDRFWHIEKDGPSGTVNVTLTATAAEVGAITNLQAQRWNTNTSLWDAPLSGQTSGATSVTVTGVTEFSIWAISGNFRPLPIELLSFKATSYSDYVSLDWETSSEKNNDYYTVQRSADGTEFFDIGTVAAGADGTALQSYTFLDENPLTGRSYYRLEQTDIDGKSKHSEMRVVDRHDTGNAITVFPNPALNGEFVIHISKPVEVKSTVLILNALGKVVLQAEVQGGENQLPVKLSNYAAGVYVLKYATEGMTFQESIMIK